MLCSQCNKPTEVKRRNKICNVCFSLIMQKVWAKKKENGEVHHWHLNPARLGGTQSEDARKKMSESHLKPENIKIAIQNLKKIDNRGEKHPMFGKHTISWNKNKKVPQITGEKNWRWIKDRTKLKSAYGSEERRSSIYKEWRRRVCNRDNWKCKINNQDCNGKLEVHHILGFKEYPKLRYEINNGITLCQAHHPRKRAEEKRLSPYFMELVSVSKE